MPREANEGTCYQARLQPQVGVNIQGSIICNIVYKQQKYLNSPRGEGTLRLSCIGNSVNCVPRQQLKRSISPWRETVNR